MARSSLQVIRTWMALISLALSLLVAGMGPALAAGPNAVQAQFDVEVYSQRGQAFGCGLSFLAGWLNADQQVLAATGTLNYFAIDPSGAGSTLKVGATLNNQPQSVSFAWIDASSDTTKSFSPLLPREPGSFSAFFAKPDINGVARLMAAANSGFTLGLTFVASPLDETAKLPAAPREVVRRLNNCISEMTARRAKP